MGRRSPHATTVRRPCAALVGRCKGRPSGAAQRRLGLSAVSRWPRPRRYGRPPAPLDGGEGFSPLPRRARRIASHRIARNSPARDSRATRTRGDGSSEGQSGREEKKPQQGRARRSGPNIERLLYSTPWRAAARRHVAHRPPNETKRNETKRRSAGNIASAGTLRACNLRSQPARGSSSARIRQLHALPAPPTPPAPTTTAQLSTARAPPVGRRAHRRRKPSPETVARTRAIVSGAPDRRSPGRSVFRVCEAPRPAHGSS